MEAASDGSLARLLEEIESSDLLMASDDDDDGNADGAGEEERDDAAADMNLILVTNLNVRVVVCDCGRGYKIPEVNEVGCDGVVEKEAAEPNNNCVVVIPEDGEKCSKKC